MYIIHQGIKIRIDTYHCHNIYSGILCGNPDSAAEEIEREIARINKEFAGPRNILVIPPTITNRMNRREEPYQLIGPISHMAWLSSSWLKPEDQGTYDGTDVFLLWFTDLETAAKLPIADAVQNQLAGLDWATISTPWGW